MLLQRKVTVKAVVTEEYKRRLIAELEQALGKVELSLRELDFQGQRYLNELRDANPASIAEFQRRLQRQKKRQEQVRGSLSDRLTTVRELVVGAEHVHAVLDCLAEVNVGDNLAQKLNAAELVIRDNIVVEIRDA